MEALLSRQVWMILLHFPVFELAGFQKLNNSLTSRRADLHSSHR